MNFAGHPSNGPVKAWRCPFCLTEFKNAVQVNFGDTLRCLEPACMKVWYFEYAPFQIPNAIDGQAAWA